MMNLFIIFRSVCVVYFTPFKHSLHQPILSFQDFFKILISGENIFPCEVTSIMLSCFIEDAL